MGGQFLEMHPQLPKTPLLAGARHPPLWKCAQEMEDHLQQQGCKLEELETWKREECISPQNLIFSFGWGVVVVSSLKTFSLPTTMVLVLFL